MARTCTASTDRVEYTTNIAATTAMSFCAWVKAPSVAGTTCKMLACQEDQWRVSFNAEKYGGGTPTAGALYFGRSWGTTDHVAEVQSPGATWSVWNHVAVTYDGAATGNAAKFYLNGTLLTNSFTRNAAGSIDNATGNPNLGNDNAHTLSCLASLAFASFHNVVLTQAEILEHMIMGYAGRGCFASWDCSGDSPERDRSGNGRLGTVTGTTVAADNPPVSLLFMSEDDWMEESLGGTLFTQTITASGTGTAAMVRQAGKGVTASGTGTASMVRSVAKAVSAAGTGTAALLRLVGKTLAATGAGTAVISATRAVLLALTASGTGTPAMTRSVGKLAIASGTGTASLARAVSMSVAASGAGSASVTKEPAKTLAASGTGTAVMTAVRVVILAITAAGTGTASLVRLVAKSLSVSGTGTPAFQKLIAKTLAVNGTGIPTLTPVGPPSATPTIVIGRYP